MKIKAGKYEIDVTNKTCIMGILNITPDSFSDGGKYNSIEIAIKRAAQMVEDGADIIDIGGESTRPGAKKISLDEELERVIPVIEALHKEIDKPISIDTYKSEVAKHAVLAGATIINDIWGAKWEREIADVAAKYDVPIIVSHNRDNSNYNDLISDLILDLQESITICHEAGVKNESIIIDPGIGFAKTYEQNIDVMRNLDKIVALNYPVLLGTSRKSIIGNTLHLPPEERLEGTQATVCFGIMKGCHIVRVHDVREISRTAKMMDALLY